MKNHNETTEYTESASVRIVDPAADKTNAVVLGDVKAPW